MLPDHQTGLFSLVGDFHPDEFKKNFLWLASSAKYFQMPTSLTTSLEQGPNGPILPELKAMFPEAPYIPRPGQINAWDNDEILGLGGPATTVIDGKGRTDFPGLNDSHLHPSRGGLNYNLELRWDGVASLADAWRRPG